MITAPWDADGALAPLPFVPWSGEVWRVHLARFSPDEANRLDHRIRAFSQGASAIFRDRASLGLAEDELLDDLNYDMGHALGLAALRRGAEGILVPSATRAGDNLIVFPDNLRPAARIEPTSDILELTHFVIP